MNINVLTMLGTLICAAALITKLLIDKNGLIPEWVYIIACAAAIVLLAAGLFKGCRGGQ